MNIDQVVRRRGEQSLRIARCTKPAKRGRAEAAISELYADASTARWGRKEKRYVRDPLRLKPPRFEWVGSPHAGAARAWELLQEDTHKRVRLAIQERLRTRMWQTASGNKSLPNMERWVAPIGNMQFIVRDAFASAPALIGSFRGSWDAWWWGPWQSRLDMGVKPAAEDRAKLDLWLETMKSCGWWFPFDDVCVCCERPTEIRVDDRGFLHCEDGPALTFPDGTEAYVWHGIRVQEWHIVGDVAITAADITKARNAEMRRALLEMYGHENYMRDSDAELVHEDEWGRLWRSPFGDRSSDPWTRRWNEPLMMVEVVNSSPEPDGSFKTYFLRVDPHLRPLRAGSVGHEQKKTALNAVASTFGLTGKQYLQVMVQT